jgi:zinc protease
MDNDAYASYITRMKAQLENLELDPMVAFSDSLTYAVYMDNPRAKRIQIADFDKISYSRVFDMYKERFADASDFVFTFVGNIDLETIRPFIKQYLATLPSVKRIEKGNVAAVPEIRKGVYQNNFKRSMEVPKSSVVSFYSGQMEYSLAASSKTLPPFIKHNVQANT